MKNKFLLSSAILCMISSLIIPASTDDPTEEELAEMRRKFLENYQRKNGTWDFLKQDGRALCHVVHDSSEAYGPNQTTLINRWTILNESYVTLNLDDGSETILRTDVLQCQLTIIQDIEPKFNISILYFLAEGETETSVFKLYAKNRISNQLPEYESAENPVFDDHMFTIADEVKGRLFDTLKLENEFFKDYNARNKGVWKTLRTSNVDMKTLCSNAYKGLIAINSREDPSNNVSFIGKLKLRFTHIHLLYKSILLESDVVMCILGKRNREGKFISQPPFFLAESTDANQLYWLNGRVNDKNEIKKLVLFQKIKVKPINARSR